MMGQVTTNARAKPNFLTLQLVFQQYPVDHSSKLLIAKPAAKCAMVIYIGLVFKRFVPWKVFQTTANYNKTSLATIGVWKVIHSSWKDCKMFIKFHSASLTFWSVLHEVPTPEKDRQTSAIITSEIAGFFHTTFSDKARACEILEDDAR